METSLNMQEMYRPKVNSLIILIDMTTHKKTVIPY